MFKSCDKKNGRKLVFSGKRVQRKKLADGKLQSRKDRLTIIWIDAIQNFYGRAIRDNKGNPPKMSEEIWAILDHFSSTESNPKLDRCPKREEGKSWSSYQRDQVTGLNKIIPTKTSLPDATLDVVKPVFTRLASASFLEQCKNCRNQNAN